MRKGFHFTIKTDLALLHNRNIWYNFELWGPKVAQVVEYEIVIALTYLAENFVVGVARKFNFV